MCFYEKNFKVWLNQATNYLHCNAAEVGISLSSFIADHFSQPLKYHHLNLYIASGDLFWLSVIYYT